MSKYQENHTTQLQANQQLDMLQKSISDLMSERESAQVDMEEVRRAPNVTREDLSDAAKANVQKENKMRSLANGRKEMENEVG